jgi:hypothetical protein
MSELGAADASVPVSVQADLVSKVPTYDRAFRERAGGRVHVLVLSNPNSSDSTRVANFIQAALAREAAIGGLPQEVTIASYSNAAALGTECKKRSISILYVTPGFDSELEAICAVVQPLGVMTFSGVPDYVRRCIVVGFELQEGRPKLLVHLGQAKKNGIRFSSGLLRLAKVYQ